ncbi:MAG TPA: hypothetical protein VGF14_06875 [Alphaproteobacteria bacterium]
MTNATKLGLMFGAAVALTACGDNKQQEALRQKTTPYVEQVTPALHQTVIKFHEGNTAKTIDQYNLEEQAIFLKWKGNLSDSLKQQIDFTIDLGGNLVIAHDKKNNAEVYTPY